MFPKFPSSPKHQRGNILMIAIFSIVALAALGVGMLKMSWSQSDTTTRDVFGTRAWFAAVSGTEFALARLFPLVTIPGVNPKPICESKPNETSFVSEGLKGCSVFVTCQKVGSDPYLQYFIESRGECGKDEFKVVRVQETWARGEEYKEVTPEVTP